MTALAYFLFDTDDQKNKPQDEIIEEAHGAEYWFADKVSSESIKPLERPRFSDLVKFTRKGDTLVVSSIEVLGKCDIELYETFQALQERGVDVVSVLEDFHLSSPLGKAFLKTLAAFTDLHRNVTGRPNHRRKQAKKM